MDKKDKTAIGISLVFIGSIFLSFAWFVSDPARAGRLDRYMLYYIDDVFHYCYVRNVDINLLAILSPVAKPLYNILGTVFYKIVPLGIVSLRIMNSLLSVGVLFVMYKLMSRIGIKLPYIILAIFLTASFPLYFLASVSSLTEITFTLFLICALYRFYGGDYFLTSVIISMLPLIRQEGLFFLIAWAIFLLMRGKGSHIYFIFIPSMVWAGVNYVTMGYSLVDTFFYIFKLTDAPPANSVARFSDMRFLYTIVYSPVVIFGLMGVILTWRDKKFNFLRACLVMYFILLGFCNFKLFAEHGVFSRELRYLICAVPLLSIFAANFCMQKMNKFKSIFFIIMSLIIISLSFTVFYIHYIQNDRGVLKDSMSSSEEAELRLAADWLQEYTSGEKIDKLYIFGQEATNSRIRRLWLSVCPAASLYSIIAAPCENKAEVLNMATLRHAYWDYSGRFIFVSLERSSRALEEILSKNKWRLLKEFPVASVFFYSG